jgi:hypothetical protein
MREISFLLILGLVGPQKPYAINLTVTSGYDQNTKSIQKYHRSWLGFVR